MPTVPGWHGFFFLAMCTEIVSEMERKHAQNLISTWSNEPLGTASYCEETKQLTEFRLAGSSVSPGPLTTSRW
jgi:hypothetical protein